MTHTRTNPLLEPSTLPYQAPRFDVIQNSDYLPAMRAGIREAQAEVDAITHNMAAPTFDNTVVALERSGALLERATATFFMVAGADADDDLQHAEEAIAPELAALSDAIFLNPALFARVKQVYNQRDALGLDDEAARLLDWYYNEFVMAGAHLSGEAAKKLAALNKEEAVLSTRFTQRLLAATRQGAVTVDDESALAGLSASERQLLATAARRRGLVGRWLVALHNTTQQPLLGTLESRTLRERVFHAAWQRAEHDNEDDTRTIIARLAALRAEQAQLLGFDDFASWTLQDQMVRTPDNVEAFLNQLIAPATTKARAEAQAIQACIDDSGAAFSLKPWDWDFYAQHVRKAQFDIDPGQIKPYLVLERVLEDGAFYTAQKLYGVSFKRRHDLPVYRDDIRVYDVYDHDGRILGLFYGDYFKRDGKGGGAWMSNVAEQSTLLGQKPIIYNVANFTPPDEGEPALLTWDDVITVFHEFGHALHGFFATQRYPSLSGTAVARDFVEFPSQFNEHWALHPEVLSHYAVHHQTGEPMPKTLVDKIRAAATFNQGYDLTETLAAVKIDMAWHRQAPDANIKDVAEFEKQVLQEAGLYFPDTVVPRYRSSYFEHIWAGGYAAGYYAYLWTQMLADDAYRWFENNGGLTRANGARFRDKVLSRGNTQALDAMYRDFVGHAPRIEPMLENRGMAQ